MSSWWFLLIGIFIGGLLKWTFDYLTDKVRIIKFMAKILLKIFHLSKKKLKKKDDLVNNKKEELD